MKAICIRFNRWLALILAGAVCTLGIAADKPAIPSALVIYQHFMAHSELAAKGEKCLHGRDCSQAERQNFFEAAVNASNLHKGLETLAAGGDSTAAYLAGLIYYENAARNFRVFRAYLSLNDTNFKKAARQAEQRMLKESAKAVPWLEQAAKAKIPEACLTLGRLYELQEKPDVRFRAGENYFCALETAVSTGRKDIAQIALEGMMRVLDSKHPLLARASSRLGSTGYQ